METISVIGLPVAVTSYSKAIDWIFEKAAKADRAYLLEAANTHVAALQKTDRDFGKAMAVFDLAVPDGMPLVWALNAQLESEKKLTDRVYGPTLMFKTLEASCAHTGQKHFLLGGKTTTLAKLKQHFAKTIPQAQIVDSYSPPFGKWPEDENDKIIDRIRESGANLVWVGLGCPKQEQWLAKHKDQLPPAVYFGIGAAFAFHSGEVKQAPAFIQKFGMEWLYRLCKEPRRLFRRYFTYNSLFLYHFAKEHITS